MSNRNPSDTLEIRGGTVGEARDFIDKPYAFLRPLKVLKIARALSHALHHELDYTEGGLVEELLPEESERLAATGKNMVDEVAAKR